LAPSLQSLKHASKGLAPHKWLLESITRVLNCSLCVLQVRGAPRSNAEAKDSEWVRQRQGLVASKPQDVNELLLADADGTILEGLSSNFFVIMGGALHTAGEGILPGTVRDLALQVRRIVETKLTEIYSKNTRSEFT